MSRRKKKKHLSKLLFIVLIFILGFFAYQNLFKNNIIEVIKQEYNIYSKIDGYNKELLSRYKSYNSLFPNLEIEDIVKGVNLDLDKYNLEFDDNINNFSKDTYYKKDNIDRYLAYQDSNNELDHHEIIRRVNSNLDKEFYVDYVNTDLSKGLLMIANKFYYLGDYEPDDLITIPSEYGGNSLKASEITVNAYINMYNAIKEETNLKLKVMKPLHVILAVVGGVIAGAAVGLLFAPEKGSDMRAKIADYLRSKKIKLKKDQLDELTE